MTGKTKKDANRCAGCGKVIDQGEPASWVVRAKMIDGAPPPGKTWGKFHDHCFDLAIESPDVILNEITKLARKGSASRASPTP